MESRRGKQWIGKRCEDVLVVICNGNRGRFEVGYEWMLFVGLVKLYVDLLIHALIIYKEL